MDWMTLNFGYVCGPADYDVPLAATSDVVEVEKQSFNAAPTICQRRLASNLYGCTRRACDKPQIGPDKECEEVLRTVGPTGINCSDCLPTMTHEANRMDQGVDE